MCRTLDDEELWSPCGDRFGHSSDNALRLSFPKVPHTLVSKSHILWALELICRSQLAHSLEWSSLVGRWRSHEAPVCSCTPLVGVLGWGWCCSELGLGSSLMVEEEVVKVRVMQGAD